ncbi:MAG TPA: MerR family transcriptional regulator [Anaerolineae bacterium]|nr:MerR family transcriptional regulator [Anaerolineae bacterium]
MAVYTVNQLAKLAGVSVRTLHHYDHIGLLKPSARTAAGYRLYGEADLLRLQQILFFKQFDMALVEIQAILDQPDFDQVRALQSHRRLLEQHGERLARLIRTIDRTILRLTEVEMSLTDEELFEGFTPEQAERYGREARERWGAEQVEATEQRIRKMTKQQWQGIKAEGEQVTLLLASLMDRASDDAEVQQAIARHHAWIENFWTPSAESYRALGQGYVEHPEFRAFYEKVRPGLAEFMRAAMEVYCDQTLA